MIWYDEDNVSYNRLINLDGIEDKILFYLLSEKDKNEEQLKSVHKIWRLIFYNDSKALINDEQHPLPLYKNIVKLIDNDSINQTDKRFFRYPFVEDSVTERNSQIRVYVDRIVPINHLVSNVSIGIEILTHNKLCTILNELYNEEEEYNNPTESYPIVQYKNRNTVLVKEVIGLLNGADIAGVGKLQFNREANINCNAQIGLSNNHNFFGIKLIVNCMMSGVNN